MDETRPEVMPFPAEQTGGMSADQPRTRLRRIGQRLGWGLVAVALLGLAWGWLRPYPFHGIVLQTPTRSADFTLLASTGRPMRLRDFQGKVVVLFFGYTACPDICPLRLSELKRTLGLLGDKAQQVQVILVTVDPAHDTATQLQHYVSAFDASFIGMTGTPAQINAVATQFGIFYDQTPSAAGTISHTGTITVIDTNGYARLLFPAGLAPSDMAQDLAELIR